MKYRIPRNLENDVPPGSINVSINTLFKTIAGIAIVLILSTAMSAAVTVDAASTAKDTNILGLSTLTWSHTVGTGSDRALYVGISSATTTLPVSVLPSQLSTESVTYNGIPMTRVGSVQSPGLLNLGIVSKSYVDIYRLVNPPSGTHNVVVTFSTLLITPSLFINKAVGGAISYNGVDQVTPNSFFASNNGTSTTPSVTVTGGTNQDLIMDTVVSVPDAEDFTVGAGQTSRWEGNFPAVPVVNPSYDFGAGSTKAGASSVTMNWTMENSRGWAHGGLAVRAASNPPSVFTVNTNLDNESNGCAVGNCTLREAINDANNTAQPDTIQFSPSVTGTITLTNGQLVASSNMTISGPGARVLAINGNNADRVFAIATPIIGGDFTVNISGITITNGNAQPALLGSTLIGDGGGILNGALLGSLTGTSTLNLTEVNISGNRATTLGGGVATRLDAKTNITRSLISSNTSNATVPVLGGDVGGGGVSNIGSTTTISNSTITKNTSLAAGGGILNAVGVVNLTNDTISHNNSTLAGGGVVSVAGILTPILGVTNVRNTIIANNNDLLAINILGRDVVGVLGGFNSLGNNLIGSNFGAEVNFSASVFVGGIAQPNANADIVGGVAVGNQVIDPLLGALQNNGGPTNTRLPYADSPAIDKGDNCVVTNTCSSNPQGNNPLTALTLEQRGTGFARVSGSNVDIGATEGTGTITPIVVNSLLDNENNGCSVGVCTLREAVNDANGTTIADTIIFQNGLTGTIYLTGGQLVIYTDVTISGPGARVIKVDGNNADRVFTIATPLTGDDITVSISGLTVQHGNAQPAVIGSTLIGDGGGILNGALLGVLSGTSTLNLTEMTIDSNIATTLGGGVATRLNAITNITRSTISNNTSNATVPALGGDVGGGGVSNVLGITTITNSTITLNHTLAIGGGILNAAGTLNLTNDTITHNSSTLAGGGVVSTVGILNPILGVSNVRNTIIANNNNLSALNILGRDVVGLFGSFNSLGNNLIGSNYGAEVNFSASVFIGGIAQPNVNADIVGNVVINDQVIDPLLGELQDNGGQTDTRMPQSNSLAVNRGNNCVVTNFCSNSMPSNFTTDQRGVGYARRRSSAVEIGSVEIPPPPTSARVSVSGRVITPETFGLTNAIVSLTDDAGNSKTLMTGKFGSFMFNDIAVGRTYILTVNSKRYVYDPQVVVVTQAITGLTLVPQQ